MAPDIEVKTLILSRAREPSHMPRVGLEDGNCEASLGEKIRGRQPCRPRADDGDSFVSAHVCGFMPDWSSVPTRQTSSRAPHVECCATGDPKGHPPPTWEIWPQKQTLGIAVNLRIHVRTLMETVERCSV